MVNQKLILLASFVQPHPYFGKWDDLSLNEIKKIETNIFEWVWFDMPTHTQAFWDYP